MYFYYVCEDIGDYQLQYSRGQHLHHFVRHWMNVSTVLLWIGINELERRNSEFTLLPTINLVLVTPRTFLVRTWLAYLWNE